jgi:hypothetical protein
MDKVTVLFIRSKGFAAKLIRAVTWSKWSHVAFVLDSNSVLDATFKHGGVKIRRMADAIHDVEDYQFVDFYVPCAAEIRLALLDEIGKPYDWTALFGLWWHRDWQENDSWFCSEFLAYGFSKGGYPMFRDESMHRITPDHWWKLEPLVSRGWLK